MDNCNEIASDAWLTKQFAVQSVADNRFSKRVVRRIRLRRWLQRLLVPGAATAGALLAASQGANLLALVSVDSETLSTIVQSWIVANIELSVALILAVVSQILYALLDE